MEKILTPIFRVSFADVFRPRAFRDKPPMYSIVMLFDAAELKKDPKQLQLFKGMHAAVDAAALARWGSNPPPNLKRPFRKGEEKSHIEGYGPGVIFTKASTKTRPGLANPDMTKIINEEEFYSGCYAHATINAFCWTQEIGQGVSFGLQNIQKVKDGEPFSGRSAVEDDFTVVGPATAGVSGEGDEDIDDLLG